MTHSSFSETGISNKGQNTAVQQAFTILATTPTKVNHPTRLPRYTTCRGAAVQHNDRVAEISPVVGLSSDWAKLCTDRVCARQPVHAGHLANAT